MSKLDYSDKALGHQPGTPQTRSLETWRGDDPWYFAFDSDTLRDRFGGSVMATEPDANGNLSVLISRSDALAIISALNAPDSSASQTGDA